MPLSSMKKTIKDNQDTTVTGTVAATSHKMRWFIISAIVIVMLVLAGGGYWWYRSHQHKPLTKEQQAAQNTVPSLQQYTQQQEQQHTPNDIRAGTTANLAIAEAVAGQCSDARRDLDAALKLAPPSSASEMNAAKKQVSNYCH